MPILNRSKTLIIGSLPNFLAFQPRNNLARDDLDLLHLVPVRHKDQLLHADCDVFPQLFDAFIDRAEDRAVLCRIAPRCKIPLLAEPFHHSTLDRSARFSDANRKLRSIEQRVRIFPAFLGKIENLGPGLCKAFSPIKISQPSVAVDGGALENAINIASDQDWRTRLLNGFWIHYPRRNLVEHEFALDHVLGPEPCLLYTSDAA